MVSNLQMWVLGGKEFVLACRNTQLFHRFTAVSCRFKVPFQGPRKIRAFLKVLSCSWNLNSGEKTKTFSLIQAKGILIRERRNRLCCCCYFLNDSLSKQASSSCVISGDSVSAHVPSGCCRSRELTTERCSCDT